MCVLIVVCSLLFVRCCLLFDVVCCVLCVVCSLFFVLCSLLFVVVVVVGVVVVVVVAQCLPGHTTCFPQRKAPTLTGESNEQTRTLSSKMIRALRASFEAWTSQQQRVKGYSAKKMTEAHWIFSFFVFAVEGFLHWNLHDILPGTPRIYMLGT